MKRTIALLAPLLPLALTTCKAGAVGDAIEPNKPTAADVMNELKCSEDQSYAEPLIVDWGSDDRTDLEVAMRDGIVVASYDCNSFRVLETCKVAGGYNFAGVSRKEDVIQFVGQDELHANFPVGGAKLAAGLDRNSVIDVALVTVGKQRTSAGKISRVQLEGDCEGATHFVRSALVGAFAVGTGTRGHAGAVAEVFKLGDVGGSSTSEHKSLNRDGDLAACVAANPNDLTPPAQCQSLLRVELVALIDDPVEPLPGGGGPPPPEPLANVCTAEGYVWDGAKCARESDAKGYRCAPLDAGECKAQCEIGNAESCHNLAILTDRGEAGIAADRAAAIALYSKACEGGNLSSCTTLVYRLDWKVESERAIALLQKTCEGGDAIACRVLGNELLRGDELPKDTARGKQTLARACSMAEQYACSDLAWYLFDAENQPDQALGVLEGDCKLGNGTSCSQLGGWLSRCEDGRPPGMIPIEVKACEKFPTTDAGRATLAFERACLSGFFGACNFAGDRYAAGKGVTASVEKARSLFDVGCPKGWYACGKLGRIYEEGKGTPVDLQNAFTAYAEGCDGSRDKGDCFDAARVAKQLGNDTDYRARLEQGCKLDSRRACDEYTKLLEDEKRNDEAKAIYGDVCDRLKEPTYCKNFTRLGGELPKDFKTFKRSPNSDPDQF